MIDLKAKARSLPLLPGVYIMMDKAGTVLYVGKAKQLKNRVSSYFQDSAGHSPKTVSLVRLIVDFDTIIAGSEFEAFVLECSLIKRHQPKFNIKLKDAKGYPFIRLPKGESYPRLEVVGKATEEGFRYFGPYAGRKLTFDVVNAVSEAVKLPVCGKKFPRDIGKERPCLQLHMDRCAAPCRGDVSESEYGALIQQAVDLLEGRFRPVINRLREEMERAAEDMLFERAAQLRDRIVSLERLANRQIVVSGSMADMDAVGFHRGEAKSGVAVLHFLEGQLFSRDVELFDNAAVLAAPGLPGADDERGPAERTDKPSGGRDPESEALLAAFLTQYYTGRTSFPKSILLPCEIEERALLERLIGEKAGRKVTLLVPRRGDKAELCTLASKNAAEEVERVTTREERERKLLTVLGDMLGLPSPPRRIEAVDISNTGDDQRVGAVTVFAEARPLKRDYRVFAVKDETIRDDFHAMREVLLRRFQRMLEGDEKFSTRPDLLLVDGGAVHAAMMARALEEIGLSLPVFGMVKDSRHRTRGLVSPGGEEIGLSAVPAVFALIGQIQEETHRFALAYHQKRREKGQIHSGLDAIPGVGPARREQLLSHFKSLKRIQSAAPEELAAVVPGSCAAAIYAHFHGNADGED